MEFKIEEERRFLVKRLPASYLQAGSREVTQWYICMRPPVRVRVEDFEDCSLTIKIRKALDENYELQDAIPKEAIVIFETARKHNKIRKTRYFIGLLELNVFYDQLEGLVLLEFERKSDKDVLAIPLDILVEEVTGDERFDNHNLAMLDNILEDWRCRIADDL